MTISRFTPSLMPRHTLEGIFVAREALLETIVERIAEAGQSTARHQTLLVGPRGAGKTHLVALAYHRTKDLMAAGVRLQVAWLPEDPWTIVSYRHLLSAILERLEPAPATPQPARGTEEELEALVIRYAREAGPVVVLLENFDLILDQMEATEQQRLRRLLQTERALLLVATSTRLDRNVSDQAAPFYGFFTTTRLRELTFDEARSMLTRLAEVSGDTALAEYLREDRALSRVRAIAHLAGGQPRIWAALSTALTVEGIDDLVDVLLTRFDDLTPYYQEQLGRLSGQMRLVVAELAEADHPLHVAELAERIGVTQRSLGKTISDLADRGWLSPVETRIADLLDRRRTYYELAEPLARLSFQIKDSRGEPLRLVVDFLKGWFDPAELAAASTLQAVSYLEMARDGFSYDPITRVVRLLGNLPETPAPALDLLGGVDDALSALSAGDPGPFLQLNAAIRNSLEERLGDPSTRPADIRSIRVDVHRFALTEIERLATSLSTPSATQWVRRAEGLVEAGQDADSDVILIEWLARTGRVHEASAALYALTAKRGLTDGRSLTARFSVAQQQAMQPATCEQGIQGLQYLLDDQVRFLGPGHPDTLTTRANLAYWRRQIGDLHGAIPDLESQWIETSRLYGADSRETLTARLNLSSAYSEAGRHDEAIALDEETLATAERVFGLNDRDMLIACNNLASSYYRVGRHHEAITVGEKALAASEHVVFPHDWTILDFRINLAYAYRAAGRYPDALSLDQATLASCERVLGADHSSTLVTRNGLVSDYLALGRFEDALLLEDGTVAARWARDLGRDHPLTLSYQYRLAEAYRAAGRYEEAVALHRKTLTVRERVLGPDHPDTKLSREGLAQAESTAET